MDLVHKTVNRATLRSMVDLRIEHGRSSPEWGRAGVPVLGSSPWQRGEQEERMGIFTPGCMSWWWGSDGRASAKGGGGEGSSMRRCLGREGEERGAEMSAVNMAGGVAPFYRVREAVEGSGGSQPARWVFKGFKRRGRGFDGVWLDEGRERDGARLGFSWCTGGARRTTAAAGRTVAAALATEGRR
jgi:hypothetical protein